MINPFKKIMEFFEEEKIETTEKTKPQIPTGIYCENCQEQIMNKPKFIKLEGRQIVICKRCKRHFKKGKV
jgi:hypothetical protein